MNTELKELFKAVPRQVVDWEKNEENGFIILKKPKFKNKYLVKYLLPHMKRKEFRINLDEIGSFVWQNIDGTSTIGEIALKMESTFGEKVAPVNDRLGQFIQSLYQNQFIRLYMPD